MHKTCIVLVYLFGAVYASTASGEAPEFIPQKARADTQRLGALSIVVLPLAGAGIQFVQGNDRSLNPASVMKLVTTYAALAQLGPSKNWRTQIWGEGLSGARLQNLYLQGSGDPKLTQTQFADLLRQLRARGLEHIEGDVILDRSFFPLPPEDPGAFDGQPMRAYNVGPDALLVDFRALRFTVQPEAGQVRLWQESPSAGLRLENKLRLGKGACQGWRDALQVQYISDSRGQAVDDSPAAAPVRPAVVLPELPELPESPEPGLVPAPSERLESGTGVPSGVEGQGGVPGGVLRIAGVYPESCGESSLYLSPLTADEHFAGLFTALWQELGGTFKGKVRRGKVPAGARLLLTHESPPLSEMVRDINKYSNNVMARQLFLALAQAPGETGLEEKAAANVRRWLAEKGLDFPELVLENGSGLSRKERISAESLARLLVAAWHSPVMPDFVASLPITGVDGTMKNRLKNTPAAGRSRIKTGSLEGVRAAAGYAMDAKGRWHVVVFMVNHPDAAASQPILDALLLWIAESGKEEDTGKLPAPSP